MSTPSTIIHLIRSHFGLIGSSCCLQVIYTCSLTTTNSPSTQTLKSWWFLGWTGSWPPYNPCVPAITIYAIYKISSPKPRSLLWFIYQITTVILSLLLQLLATILLIVITISLEPSFQIVVWNKITIPPVYLSVEDKSRSLIIRKFPIHDWISVHITTKHEELFLLLKH